MNPDLVPLDINLETPVAEIFRYAFFTDREEGLIVVDSSTFSDHNPRNNKIKRAVTYNPDNRLAGAVKIRIAGNYAYIVSETTGLQIVDVSNPLSPQWVAEVGAPYIESPRAVVVQFRYAFVVDAEGFKVVDVSTPEEPRPHPEATVQLPDARGIYVMRSYAYVAAGSEGLAVIDIERPDRAVLVEKYSAAGQINDAYSLTVGTVNASTFAFLADGSNGLRVLRLVGPPDVPGALGFSPRPVPKLIATHRTRGPATAVADGVQRDRSVDESGNQIGVGGRVGSRPMNQNEMDKLLRRNGEIFTVED